MRIKTSSGICVAAFSMVMVFLLIPSIALAKRGPTVCDDLSGKAYGLCNAYCEALDCDWDPNASEVACEDLRFKLLSLTGESEFPCETMSLGCVAGDTGLDPPNPFDVNDGNDYGERVFELTVPKKCECDGPEDNCIPCPIVVGFHGYGEDGSTWKKRLEPKGRAVGFISLYPTGDMTPNSYTPAGTDPNWAVPSCQEFTDGCEDEEYCDWCGDINEDDDVSTQREIDFTRAIIEWTMENYCVDPDQIFATGFSNGGLWSHTLARHPDTSGLFKALVPVDGVDQAGVDDKLKWIHAPQDSDSPWILHVNEVFDRFEPYDGRPYNDYAPWWPTWIYPPVLQIFAKYAAENAGYSACGFGSNDVGDRFGEFVAGGVVPAGYRKLDGPNSLEGEGQRKFHCFTKDAGSETCEKLAICLWDSGPAGDDYPDPHGRAGKEWTGGTDRGTGGTKPMDIMWRFMKASVGVPY
jgi:predicted esterase